MQLKSSSTANIEQLRGTNGIQWNTPKRNKQTFDSALEHGANFMLVEKVTTNANIDSEAKQQQSNQSARCMGTYFNEYLTQ